jgi:hypothetical protein
MKACNFLFMLSLFFVITGNLFIAIKFGQPQNVINSTSSLYKKATSNKKGRTTSSSIEDTNELKSSVPEILLELNTLSVPEKEFESK